MLIDPVIPRSLSSFYQYVILLLVIISLIVTDGVTVIHSANSHDVCIVWVNVAPNVPETSFAVP